jgi:hypothetical protein
MPIYSILGILSETWLLCDNPKHQFAEIKFTCIYCHIFRQHTGVIYGNSINYMNVNILTKHPYSFTIHYMFKVHQNHSAIYHLRPLLCSAFVARKIIHVFDWRYRLEVSKRYDLFLLGQQGMLTPP